VPSDIGFYAVNDAATIFWHIAHMPDENPQTLRQVDQLRTDIANVESGASGHHRTARQAAEAGRPHENRARRHSVYGSARHSVSRSVLAPTTEATTVPGAPHYREVAGMLRQAARSCQFVDARKEILHLAARFESRADHLDRRAASMIPTRLE
jgi:hypothetical protein